MEGKVRPEEASKMSGTDKETPKTEEEDEESHKWNAGSCPRTRPGRDECFRRLKEMADVWAEDDDGYIPQVKEEVEVSDEDSLPEECFAAVKGEAYKKRDIMKRKMSVNWFRKINMPEQQYKKLCFCESLLMMDEAGNVSGKMYASVKPAKWGERRCLVVHSGSYGTPDPEMECGTTITGFVSFDMKTLNEFVHEWAKYDGKVMERKTFIIQEEGGTLVKILMIQDGVTVEQKAKKLGRLEQQLLVTESAHIVLLRLIIQEKRALGHMDLKSVSFMGTVVNCKYTAMAYGWETVRGEEIRTWTIRRVIYFDFGERYWDSVLNSHGRLILRCQPENIHGLIPLWFEPVLHRKNKPGCLPPYVWACDPDLYAKYMMKREELALSNRSYLLLHPELRALLSDFCQAVLQRKPTNLIPFAQQYFEPFLKYAGGQQEDTESVVSTPYAEDEGEYWWGEGEGGDWTPRNMYDDLDQYYSIPPIQQGFLPLPGQPDFDQESIGFESVIVGPDGTYIPNVRKENGNPNDGEIK